MLTILVSLLFGFIAFGALAEICVSFRRGMAGGRLILAELRRDEARGVSRRRAPRPVSPLRLAAA